MKHEAKKGIAGSNLGIQAERSTTAQLKDSSSNKMRKAATAVGNEELKTRIESGKANRDELMMFLVGRLKTIRSVQEKELSLADLESMRKWGKTVSDQQKGVTKPEPTRWREVAQAYEAAAFQLCRGALGAGKQLLQKAIEVEKRTIGNVTELVDVSDAIEPPDMMQALGDNDGSAPATNLPQEVHQLVNDIVNVTAIAPEPSWKKRVRDPWWTLEEEEEEEEGAGKGGGGGGGGA